MGLFGSSQGPETHFTAMTPNDKAAYSARYILEELNNADGIAALAKLTGLPEGVIAAALENIFPPHHAAES